MSARKSTAPKRTYRVASQITISVLTDVVASSAAEAKRLALTRRVMRLCCQCADGDSRTKWVTSGELDGDPREILRVEAIDE